VTGNCFHLHETIDSFAELSGSVDIYNEWIDCCDAENQVAEKEDGEDGEDGFVV
jgi:transcription elongation factor Elf1